MSKPTRVEVLAEPAGHRLDAWVAEYACGWKWYTRETLPSRGKAFWLRSEEDVGWLKGPLTLMNPPSVGESEGHVTNAATVPEYSTSWADAGPLLEKLAGKLSLIRTDDGHWHLVSGEATAERDIVGHGETPQLAIARAAVLNVLDAAMVEQ